MLEGKTLAEKPQANEVQAVESSGTIQEPEARAKDTTEPHRQPQPVDPQDTDAIVRAAKAMRDVHQTHQARPKICLIVDDSRVIRKVSRKIATSLGYTSVEAENGEEALARCKQKMPDLVLTDWQMPEMDGIEFVRQLRSIPTPHRPTVVFCTSKGAAADIHEGIAAGADDYVIKPFDETTLSAKLEKLRSE